MFKHCAECRDPMDITDIIARSLWESHIKRQAEPAVWMSWEDAVRNKASVAIECIEDAQAIADEVRRWLRCESRTSETMVSDEWWDAVMLADTDTLRYIHIQEKAEVERYADWVAFYHARADAIVKELDRRAETRDQM